MKETQALSQNLQQTQRLSPRQVQFARLLEMTGLEVEEELRRQIDDNPALEVVEDSAPETSDLVEEVAGSSSQEDVSNDGDDYEDDPADYMSAGMSSENAQWQIAADAPDLLESLQMQLRHADLPPLIEKIALYIIGNLDENGYLTRGLMAMADDIAIATSVDVSMDDMKRAFEAVRSLDPAGVGAVDLRDCLLIQLKRMTPNTFTLRVATEIVADHFDLLSKKHYDRLQSQLGLDNADELRNALKLIRQLNPKPGSAIEESSSSMRLSQITPDVLAEEDANGRWTVSLANRLPQLQVERSFSIDPGEEKHQSKSEREAQAFIRLKRDDAEAFINALRLRGNTLLAVAEAMVKRQPEFFRTGDQSTLKPMILKDISADTGIELSAVSRATAGKYIATSTGTYPMKMLFNEAPTDDSDASSHKMMDDLKKIVDAEDKSHPLSDQAILEEMDKRGYKLARRTVTKYRERLGIPVGRLRREEPAS